MQEASRYVNTTFASEGLKNYLDKIQEIENQSQFIPDSYEGFKRGTYLDTDLNEHTR